VRCPACERGELAPEGSGFKCNRCNVVVTHQDATAPSAWTFPQRKHTGYGPFRDRVPPSIEYARTKEDKR
jgi:hypothetical protein